MAGNGSSAEQIAGDSHVFAPLGTPPAISPPLAASPSTDGDSSGWGGTPRQGCPWVETPRSLSLAARRASRGPWILGTQTRTLAFRFSSKGHVAAVTESQGLARPAARILVLLRPPHRRVPSPGWELPPAWPGRHRVQAQVCQALGVIFFFSHQTALKKEMRSGLFCGWDSLWRAASCLPLLCCNTGNLLLLTPGVVSNSQMVLTSVSGNWWPTCLTL